MIFEGISTKSNTLTMPWKISVCIPWPLSLHPQCPWVPHSISSVQYGWNACSFAESLQHPNSVPQPIQQLVQKQNLEFHHNKSHFSYSYYQFLKQLLTFNYNYIRQQMEVNAATPSVRGWGLMWVRVLLAARSARSHPMYCSCVTLPLSFHCSLIWKTLACCVYSWLLSFYSIAASTQRKPSG